MVTRSLKPIFVPPTSEKINAALGKFNPKEAENEEYLRSLMKLFDPIPKPGRSDWLAEHAEYGQTYEQFARGIYTRVSKRQKTIYLQPLEKEISTEMLSTFEKFLSAYFPDMIIKVNAYIDLEKEKSVASRINDFSLRKQYNASDILKLLQSKVPRDSYCTIGCTMTDLYPQDSWNFVFGLANIENGVGVFSFARYDENFFLEKPLVETDPTIIIYRASKVMAHEIGHMFGIKHCIYFRCLMNGSNNLEENATKPIEFCPNCLRKLQSNIGFDIAKRYKGLEVCFQELGGLFEADIGWYKKAIALAESKEPVSK